MRNPRSRSRRSRVQLIDYEEFSSSKKAGVEKAERWEFRKKLIADSLLLTGLGAGLIFFLVCGGITIWLALSSDLVAIGSAVPIAPSAYLMKLTLRALGYPTGGKEK